MMSLIRARIPVSLRSPSDRSKIQNPNHIAFLPVSDRLYWHSISSMGLRLLAMARTKVHTSSSPPYVAIITDLMLSSEFNAPLKSAIPKGFIGRRRYHLDLPAHGLAA